MHFLHQSKCFFKFSNIHLSKVRRRKVLLSQSKFTLVCRHTETTEVVKLWAHMWCVTKVLVRKPPRKQETISNPPTC